MAKELDLLHRLEKRVGRGLVNEADADLLGAGGRRVALTPRDEGKGECGGDHK
jgi:hypothetical protein